MDLIIGFILGLLACGFLWALRELERRQAFENAAEEIETLRAREGRYQKTLACVRDGAHDIRIGLGGTGKLPAPAEPAGQHYSNRVTTQLRGIPGPSPNGGPDF